MQEKNLVKDLLYSLLCKRRRRRRLVLEWNAQPPFKGQSVECIMKRFVECILSEPIHFSIENTTVYFFRDKLKIPMSAMQQDERHLINEIIHRKHAIFKSEQKLESNGQRLTHCVFDADLGQTFNIYHRREMVRDAVQYLCCLHKRAAYFKYVFLNVCQQLIAKYVYSTDRFVLELHHALQLQSTARLENLIVRDE